MELKMVAKSNRKPADELADIRARIKELSDREQYLREEMVAGHCSLVGDEYRAVIQKRSAERLDIAKLRAEMGLQFLRPFLRSIPYHYLKLKKRTTGTT